jgi:uncharacterized protein (TIGR02117 family)
LLLANPIHTDIALPADPDVLERFGFLAESGMPLGDGRVKWLIVGWGGRSFYLETPTWSDLKPGPAIAALTVDASVMHVGVTGDIPEGTDGITPIDLSPQAFAAVMQVASNSFASGSDGRPILIEGRSYGAFDRFYEAKGRFNAVVGCNTWTGAVLRQGGIRTGWWNPMPQSLNLSLRLFNDLP